MEYQSLCIQILQYENSEIRVFLNAYIVDLTFRITTCRSLLAIAFRTWDLVCINLSFASRDFVCPRFVHQEICETNYQSGESQTPCFGLATIMSGGFSRELDQYSYNG